MNKIESILDECLRRMSTDHVPVERLLLAYPEHASELRPLLETAARVQAGIHIAPRPGYRAEARNRLHQQIASKPTATGNWLWPVWRLAAAVASVLIILLASTTALAQSALPGQALYDWKLGSEIVWRTISLDRVGVDLSLAGRRTDELTSVAQDPGNLTKAREEFHEVLDRLKAERDAQNADAIDNALQAHQLKLEKQGIKDSKLDEMVKQRGPKNK